MVTALQNFFKSFTGRMVTLALIVHTFLAIALAFGVNHIVTKEIKDDFVNHVRSDSYQLGLLVEGKETPDAIREALQDATLGGQILEAEIALNDGSVINSNSSTRQSNGLVFEEDLTFDEHDGNAYRISVPINSAWDGLSGTLHLAYDKASIRARILEISQNTRLLAVTYFIVGLFFTWISSHLLSAPMRSLRDLARKITQGEPDTKFEVSTRIAEAASLAQDLESMHKELLRRGAELHHLAYRDSLTGLSNRSALHEQLTAALGLLRHAHQKMAVFYIDLDRFKRINDSMGHSAGDELLREVSKRIHHHLRQSDVVGIAGRESSPPECVARLGGDEFCALLAGITQADAEKVAQRILDALRLPVSIGSDQVHVTASIGIAFYPDHGTDSQTLIKSADEAMYNAKRRGKNCFECYLDVHRTHLAAEHLHLEEELHKAIELDQFVLHYQPQLDMVSGKLVGAEALLRWQHPKRGLLLPAEFITIAEASDLIMPIGEWVIRTACAQLKSWQKNGLLDLRIAVNLSAKQFKRASFGSRVAAILNEFSIGPNRIEFEITESMLMDSNEEIINNIKELRSNGVRFSVDDFGTGYSSLGYLMRFPLDALKIDRSFIRDLTEDSTKVAIVRAIIGLAKNLNLLVIAEGVETQLQWQFLSENECDEAQGYLIAKPMPIEGFAEFAARTEHDVNVEIFQPPAETMNLGTLSAFSLQPYSRKP